VTGAGIGGTGCGAEASAPFVRELTEAGSLLRLVREPEGGLDNFRTAGFAGWALEKTSVLVLIAEDQANIREILRISFEDGGFAVLPAATAEEAMAALDSRGDDVRALVTDIKLGAKATGWDVARHAREMKPDMPVVYMTGSDGHEWASLGVQNSILVPKHFAPAQILTAVSQLLNAGPTPGT